MEQLCHAVGVPHDEDVVNGFARTVRTLNKRYSHPNAVRFDIYCCCVDGHTYKYDPDRNPEFCDYCVLWYQDSERASEARKDANRCQNALSSPATKIVLMFPVFSIEDQLKVSIFLFLQENYCIFVNVLEYVH